MNFAQVRQIMGQKDDKGYDLKLTMFGALLQVGGVSYTQGGKQTCMCKVIDDTGEAHNVHFYGKALPSPAQLNQRLSLTISSFQGTGQGGSYTGYHGFWNAKAGVNQQPQQQAPQSPPQRPQTAPQAANAPNVGQRTNQDAFLQQEAQKQISIERQTAWKGACWVYTGLGADDTGLRGAVVDLAQAGLHFIQTGEYSPNYPPPDPSIQEDEDIPF